MIYLERFLFFLVAALPIVMVTTMVAHADDATAVRRFPQRMLTFVVACGLVVAVMLLAERVFLP